ncbi:MAG: hypothetical protein AB7E95_03450 [Kiritimatiellales bacterium]
MKRLMITGFMAVLAASAFSMSKAPTDAQTCGSDKACAVKDASSCCTADGACKDKADKACSMKKAAEEKAGCSGGTCPLSK